MENKDKGFFEWAVTRWYFYIILLSVAFLGETEVAFYIGRLIGGYLITFIILGIVFGMKKQMKGGKRKK